MKIKIENLTEKQIDFAVARLLNDLPASLDDWTQTWPRYCRTVAGDDVMDLYGISVIRCDDNYETDAKGFTTNKRIPVWAACVGQESYTTSTEHQQHDEMYQIYVSSVQYASSRRGAAMRAFLCWNLGKREVHEVDIPEELLQ